MLFGYKLTVRGYAVLVVLGLSVVFGVVSLIRAFDHHTYYTCSQLNAAGYYGVKAGDANYQPGLDRNKDGIECK